MRKPGAVDVAERAAQSIVSEDTQFRARFGRAYAQSRALLFALADAPDSSTDDDFPRIDIGDVTKDDFGDIKVVAGYAHAVDLWRRTKIVYDFDPDLWRALGHTDSNAELPTDIFDKLPHPNPYLALPEPITVSYPNGRTHRIDGAFVIGSREFTAYPGSTYVCSTTRPGTRPCLLFGGPSTRASGEVEPAFMLAHLPREHRTLQDIINFLVQCDCKDHDDDLGGQTLTDEMMRLFHAAIPPLVTALTYLCATNAELRPLPPSPAKGGKARRGFVPTQAVQVGFRIGAKLRAYAEHESRSTGTGGTVAPHVRRAHFHTYRVGPGRVDKKLEWLAPIPVNMPDGDAVLTTAIPV